MKTKTNKTKTYGTIVINDNELIRLIDILLKNPDGKLFYELINILKNHDIKTRRDVIHILIH